MLAMWKRPPFTRYGLCLKEGGELVAKAPPSLVLILHPSTPGRFGRGEADADGPSEAKNAPVRGRC